MRDNGGGAAVGRECQKQSEIVRRHFMNAHYSKNVALIDIYLKKEVFSKIYFVLL